jgi:AraC-like DNA-binding protein/Tfp pilus assembly protein PilF
MNRAKTIWGLVLLSFIPLGSLSQNHDVISEYRHLPPNQLLDSAGYYYGRSRFDTALIFYNLYINSPVVKERPEEPETLIKALDRAAEVYYRLCDYRRSYELSIQALDLCEKYGYDSYKSKIYINIGNIYYRFGKFDIARQYDLRALHFCRDSVLMVAILNNLGDTEGGVDSTWHYLNRALDISMRHGKASLNDILNNLALYYQKHGQFDSALQYFRMALDEAHRTERIESQSENLHLQGRLFSEMGRTDSAVYYIERSNELAKSNRILRIQADNHLAIAQIEERRGREAAALKHFKIYTELRDSIINTEIFGDITQFQRFYEISKTDRVIEQLTIDQQVKQRIITYQMITVAVLILACIIFLIQKRYLNKAYKALVAKNLTIIEFQDGSHEKYPKKYQKSDLTSAMQRELMDKILVVMENTSAICDTEFSLDHLAELVNSNRAYVSQTINATLNKNFRQFLYDYRIREAQRLFADPDTAKYTIEAVALKVGFKSRTAFREAFMDITGVSPAFYIKSMGEQLDLQ